MDTDLFDFDLESATSSDSSPKTPPQMFTPYAPNDDQSQPFNDKQHEYQAQFSQDYPRVFSEPSHPQWGAQSHLHQQQSLYPPFDPQLKPGEDGAQGANHWGFMNRSTEGVPHRFSVSGDRGFLQHDLGAQVLHHRASEPQLFRRMSYAGHEGNGANNHANFTDMRLSSSHSTSSVTSSSSDYPTHPSPFESPFVHHPDDVVYSEPLSLSADPLSLQPSNLNGSPDSVGYEGSEYSANSDLVKNEDGSPLMVPTQVSSSRSPPAQIYRPSSSSSNVSHLPPQPGSGVVVMHTDDAASKETQFLRRRCFNCHTTEPPSWRRSTLNTGKIVCNKCGLYERTHMRPRPPRFDEMRSGNPKVRKTSKTLVGVPPLSPNMKGIRGIKKERPASRQGGLDSRRSSFSSTTSDWEDNSLPYTNGGSLPNSAGYTSAGSEFGFAAFQQQQHLQQQTLLHQSHHGPSPPIHNSTVDSSPIRIPHPPSVPLSSSPASSYNSINDQRNIPMPPRKAASSPYPYPSLSFDPKSHNAPLHYGSNHPSPQMHGAPLGSGISRPPSGMDYFSQRQSYPEQSGVGQQQTPPPHMTHSNEAPQPQQQQLQRDSFGSPWQIMDMSHQQLPPQPHQPPLSSQQQALPQYQQHRQTPPHRENDALQGMS